MSDNGKEVEFRLTRDEYADYVRLVCTRMQRIGKANTLFFTLNVVAWVLIGMGVTGIVRFYELYDGVDFLHLNLALALFTAALVWLIAVSSYQRRFYLRHAVHDDGYILAAQRFHFGDDSLTITTRDSSQTVAWPGIMAVETTDKLVCLFIDNSQAFVIPKRAFASEAQLAGICGFIEHRQAACSPR